VVSVTNFETMKKEGKFIEFTQKPPEKGAHWYGIGIEEVKKSALKGNPFVLVSADAVISLKFQSPNIKALYLKAKKEEEDPQASNRFDEVITLPNREGSGIELIAQKMMSLAGKTTRA
jgi:guanylate kinase